MFSLLVSFGPIPVKGLPQVLERASVLEQMTTADGLKHVILFYSDFIDCVPSAWRLSPYS